MVDVARGIAEDIPVDIILVAEGKNIGIPLRQSLHAFFFRNPLPAIRYDAGVFLNILERKEPLAGDTRFRDPYAHFHPLTSYVQRVPCFIPNVTSYTGPLS